MTEREKQTDCFTVLVAEDDPDDRFMIERAFEASGISTGTLLFVEDGQELLEHLFRRLPDGDADASPWPLCILLDLKMPRKNGREALCEIRQHPDFKDFSVIVLTTSDADVDKKYCLELGVSDYIKKPDSFTEMVDLMKKIAALCVS